MSQKLPALAENCPADHDWQFNPIAVEKNKRQYKTHLWHMECAYSDGQRNLTQTPEKDGAYSQRT